MFGKKQFSPPFHSPIHAAENEELPFPLKLIFVREGGRVRALFYSLKFAKMRIADRAEN